MKYLILFTIFISACGSNVVMFPESQDSTGLNRPEDPNFPVENKCSDEQKNKAYQDCVSKNNPLYCHLKKSNCMNNCAVECSHILSLQDCSCQNYYVCFNKCELECLQGECL